MGEEYCVGDVLEDLANALTIAGGTLQIADRADLLADYHAL